MTGQTPSNEWGVESSGFVTTEFSDYREKKNSAGRRGGSGRGTDVNYKEKVIYAEGRNGKKRERHNSLLFNVRSFTPAYCGVHTLRLASFQSVGCSARWRGSDVTYKKGHVSQEVLSFIVTNRMLTFCLTDFLDVFFLTKIFV